MSDFEKVKRQPDEGFMDYQLRIGRNRELYGLSWSEVSVMLNSQPEVEDEYTESKWRKDIQAYLRVHDHLLEKNVGLAELEQKKIEIDEARKKMQTIRVDYHRDVREKARKDLMFEHVKNSIERLPMPKINPIHKSYNGNRKGILSFGDIHFGKEFKSLNNEYSEGIAKQRMEKLIGETLEIIEREGFDEIDVINGADNIEGMTLRVSQLQSLASGFIDQTIKFSKFYATWLNELSKYVKLNVHQITSSNHTEIRPFNSKRGEFPSEDLERLIGHYVKDVLANNNRININLYDKGFADFELLGFNIASLHGHQLKNNKNAIRDLSMLHRKFFDYLFVYHFHHGNELTVGQGENNNIKILQTPSIMGSDEYSDSLMTGAKPGAAFYVFEEGKGKKITYDIDL